ncbi:MAG: hypothetical protein D3922_00415 [Candidatus Electrothrix sp. AR1]|nr:hypothetical protein [Candidatus Electrothrix sp. AR1]
MELHIYLKNDKEHFLNIKDALKQTKDQVFLKEDNIVISNSSIINEYINLFKEQFADAQNSVKNYLNSINGTAKLFYISMPTLEVAKILFKHNDGSWLPVPVSETIHCELILRFGNVQQPDISKQVKLSSHNEQAAKATRLYFQEINWINLYRIFEIMKSDKYNFPKKQLTSFTMSANKVEISGDDARHGTASFHGDMPKNTMNIDEAHEFIAEHMRKWLSPSSSF